MAPGARLALQPQELVSRILGRGHRVVDVLLVAHRSDHLRVYFIVDVKGSASNRADDTLVEQTLQRPEVAQRGYSSGGYHGNACKARGLSKERYIGAGLSSVARDVGHNDGGDARIAEADAVRQQ